MKYVNCFIFRLSILGSQRNAAFEIKVTSTTWRVNYFVASASLGSDHLTNWQCLPVHSMPLGPRSRSSLDSSELLCFFLPKFTTYESAVAHTIRVLIIVFGSLFLLLAASAVPIPPALHLLCGRCPFFVVSGKKLIICSKKITTLPMEMHFPQPLAFSPGATQVAQSVP